MIVSFVCPSSSSPMGGVTVLYELANGLSRRGHEVHIAHGAFWGRPGVSSLEELSWFRFEPGVAHHFGEGPIPLPDADVIFGTEAPAHLGLPVLVIQGFEMFPEEIERAVFRTPCLKVCVASWLMDVGRQYGVPPEQFVLVPCGIDLDTFRITSPLEERQEVVGLLHNVHPAKGWRVGRATLERVHEHRPGMRALAFGSEVPDEELPPWMTFVAGAEPEVLVQTVYNRCRVFLQPSFFEGFGLTAVEAMACGCALVSTDNGGSRDYALPGRTALVAAPGDVDQLAAHVGTLLRDDAQRLRLATAGHQHVARFRWDRSTELLEAHLHRYLADPAAFQQPPSNELSGEMGE